jgi:hypothetical protein
MRLFSFLAFLISARLSYIFYKLKKNTTQQKVLPLANVMFVKSIIFSTMSFLISVELALYHIIPNIIQEIYIIHWVFGIVFVTLLFISQLYLYWLAEMRNGWH